jgi:DnaJ-class molecular chaperone
MYTTAYISPIEAMIGCNKTVKTITGQQLDIDIRPGIDAGAEFASNGNGFPNINTGQKGRLVIVISIKTPAITDPILVEKLKALNVEINSRS